MATPKNPYELLSSDKYWKTGVAHRSNGDRFSGIWTPKYEIASTDRFLTAGSCFAQHISRWLKAHDYVWLDSEPAPEHLTPEEKSNNSYGVFSFRTGNMYTAALLRQWIAQAVGDIPVLGEVVSEDGRYFDPFRPSVALRGYDSVEELTYERHYTIKCIKEGLERADIFVFTLGLTEGWQNVAGYVYPICPGTIRGIFDSDIHQFINYSYAQIKKDILYVINAIRNINANMKFLFTVSPVPLTATATGNHVLVATTYSKSVLRAVAGHLADTISYVDYFPSYELISSFPVKALYYDDNLRTVTNSGVDFVMSHFGSALKNKKEGDFDHGEIEPKCITNLNADVICDDIVLETWQKRDGMDCKIVLIGDSHLGKLSNSFDRYGIIHAGGAIMNGSAWAGDLFHLDVDDLFVPLENKSARKRWLDTLESFDFNQKDSVRANIVISNIGMQTHVSVISFMKVFLHNNPDSTLNDIKNELVNYNRKKYTLIKMMIDAGLMVIIISDPPTQFVNNEMYNYLEMFKIYDIVSCSIFSDLGCEVLNMRQHFDKSEFHEKYCSNEVDVNGLKDWIHGSTDYYDEVTRLLVDRYALHG